MDRPPRKSTSIAPAARATVAATVVTAALLAGPLRLATDAAATATLLAHLIAGAAATGGVAWSLARGARPGRSAIAFGAAASLSGLGLVAIALAGGVADRPPWVREIHRLTGGIVAAGMAIAWFRGGAWRRPAGVVALAAIAFGAVAAFATREVGRPSAAYDREAVYRAVTSTSPEQAESELFPAGLRLAGGRRLAAEQQCTGSGCHAVEVASWRRSGHACAADSAAYRWLAARFAAAGRDRDARWCRGCHAPATLLSAQAAHGVSCEICHGALPGWNGMASLGNGCLTLSAEPPPAGNPFSAMFVRLRPGPHRAAYQIRATNPDELCAPCHRVALTAAQNGYRHLPGQDEWGTWLASRFSGARVASAEIVGSGSATRSCLDCHSSAHGGGTATPVAGDLQLRLFLGREAPGQRSPPLEPAEAFQPSLRAGEWLRLHLVVANRGVGHAFPTGPPELRRAWIEVEVRDAVGRVVARSGGAELDDEAHLYGAIGIDRDGNEVAHGEAHAIVAYAVRRLLLPDEPDVVRYRWRLPAEIRWPLAVRARLWDRRFRPEFGKLLREVAGDDGTPRLVAEGRWWLAGQGAAAPPEEADAWHDYGLGLLRQGDLVGAAHAMERVLALEPRAARGAIGLGRVRLAEGDLLAARAHFEEAERRAPADLRVRALLGETLARMGQFEPALALLEPLAARFPRDAALHYEIGLARVRNGEDAAAVAAFERALAVEPYHAPARYQLLLCLQRLRRLPEARQEEVIYQSVRDDENLRPLVSRYLRRHPHRAREAQPIHEHVLVSRSR